MPFDDVPDAPLNPPAYPTAPPTYPASPPYAPAPPPPPPYAAPAHEDLPVYVTWPPPASLGSPTRPKRSRVMIAIASIGVLLAGAFAVVSLGGSGGASSPEAAVERFMSALDKEDAIGMLSAMAPAERDVLRPFLTGMNEQLARLGIIKKVDLSAVSGFDIQIQGLKLDHTDVLPGISRVNFRAGTAKFSTQPDSVPIGDVLRGLIEANGGDATVSATSSESDLGAGGDSGFLVAINSGDGWYLSAAFTIAEQARQSSGAPVPDPRAAVQPRGAASPDAAVRQLLDDIGALNLEQLIGDLPPDEMAALDLYAPLFLGKAQSAIDRAVGGQFRLEIRDLQTETEGVDGGVRVTVKAFSGSITFGDSSIDVDSSDGCVTMSMHGGGFDNNGSSTSELNGKKICPGDQVPSLGSDALNSAFARIGQAATKAKVGFIVVQQGGKFFVSPLRTISDALLQVLSVFERTDLEKGGALYELFTGGAFDSSTFSSGGSSASSSSGSGGSSGSGSFVPPGDPAPTTTNAALKVLASACQRGSGAACDELTKAAQHEGEQKLEQYGATCGGRLGSNTTASDLSVTCTDIMGG